MEGKLFEQKGELNILTNYEETAQAMIQVEGLAWFNTDKRNYGKGQRDHTVQGCLDYLHGIEGKPDKETYTYIIYGGGGMSRWVVFGNGDVTFSEFHDRDKAQKAKAIGFKMF